MIKIIMQDPYCKKMILTMCMLLSIGAVVMFFFKALILFKIGATFIGIISAIASAFWICMIVAIIYIVYRDFFKKR